MQRGQGHTRPHHDFSGNAGFIFGPNQLEEMEQGSSAAARLARIGLSSPVTRSFMFGVALVVADF